MLGRSTRSSTVRRSKANFRFRFSIAASARCEPGKNPPAANCWTCSTTPRRSAIRNPRPPSVLTVASTSARRVWFNTTPDIRVPAFVLVPKHARKPAPALVALHDHGGFYLWGKEKIVEMPEEHPVVTEFKRNYYGGRSIANELVRQGYIVVIIDMFYWGERRMILNDDPDDWRTRPSSITRERIQAFNSRAGQNEQLVGRTIYSAGFTWPGVMFWDDIRTVDYLLTRPDVDKQRIGCVGLSVGGLRSCHLAALDDRIKGAVVVGWMASFPWQLKKHIRNYHRPHQGCAWPLSPSGLSGRCVAGDADAVACYQRQ